MSTLASKGLKVMSVTGDNDSHNSDELWKGAYQLIFFTPESFLLNRYYYYCFRPKKNTKTLAKLNIPTIRYSIKIGCP